MDSQWFRPIPTPTTSAFSCPRAALKELQVLGVVGSALRRRKPKPPAKEQIGLFE